MLGAQTASSFVPPEHTNKAVPGEPLIEITMKPSLLTGARDHLRHQMQRDECRVIKAKDFLSIG